jgi:hypothetical protein
MHHEGAERVCSSVPITACRSSSITGIGIGIGNTISAKQHSALAVLADDPAFLEALGQLQAREYMHSLQRGEGLQGTRLAAAAALLLAAAASVKHPPTQEALAQASQSAEAALQVASRLATLPLLQSDSAHSGSDRCPVTTGGAPGEGPEAGAVPEDNEASLPDSPMQVVGVLLSCPLHVMVVRFWKGPEQLDEVTRAVS